LPVPGGYQALAGILAQGLDVRMQHAVSRVVYGPSGVHVTCANGAAFSADCVLVTTSLGVLQSSHASLFDPPLPEWKQEALGALRIGVADKVCALLAA
jgi:monoamine oxidase